MTAPTVQWRSSLIAGMGAGWLALLVGLAGPRALVAVLGLGVLLAAAVLTARLPHVAAGAVVAYLIVEPAINTLVAGGSLGPTRHAAVIVVVLSVPARRIADRSPPRSLDGWLVLFCGLLAFLYLASPQRAHDAAWAQGCRYVLEPLLLLVAAAAFPDARRAWRWAAGGLVTAAAVAAVFGIAQQLIGPQALVNTWGYQYGSQIRIASSGALRSIGTFDDPFVYAVMLLAAIAVVLNTRPRSARPAAGQLALGVVLAVGVAVANVRTALVIAAVLVLLALLRHARPVAVVAIVAVLGLGGGAYLLATSAPSGDGRPPAPSQGGLNGRTDLWARAIGSPGNAITGLGAGALGSGATRAEGAVKPDGGPDAPAVNAQLNRAEPVQFIDSLYVTTLVDTGVVGVCLLLAVLARAGQLGGRAARRRDPVGWVVVGLVAILAIDGVTRSSLTSVPSGLLLPFLIGLGLAACADRQPRCA